jgi:hypothetical protein
MSHSSMYFCPYCTASKNLKQKRSEARTANSIKEHFENWLKNTGGEKSKASSYKNCVGLPLVFDAEHFPIHYYIPPPELHIIIGIVTHLFTLLEKDNPQIAEEWRSRCQVQYFHGQKQFNGNSSKKLLERTDILQEIDGDNRFIKLFSQFNVIVSACFGQTLDERYAQYIDDFFDSVNEMNIPMTNKMHVLLFHVKDFINHHNCSLGYFSEQTVETVHFDFSKFSPRYLDHVRKDNILNALLRTVCAYNSSHL